jgi:hypothetical protein
VAGRGCGQDRAATTRIEVRGNEEMKMKSARIRREERGY